MGQLPPDKAEQLVDEGFTVIDGPYPPSELSQLSQAYDDALATADPVDVRVSSSTRAWDIVSRTPEFERVYTHAPLLHAARIVVGEGFKLSATCFRSLNPQASAQSLHVDVQYQEDGWPILGFILMVDAFSSANGATRFVRGSHKRTYAPHASSEDVETLACGAAGSMIVFNGSTWHGHSRNVTERTRRSIQGHFIPRHARTAIDYGARLDAKSLSRIGTVGRQVLGFTSGA